jgi:hypothetical protein
MWSAGELRVLPSEAAVCIATSTDANDDGNPASTGASVIRIEGLDANYDEITEDITLEGLSNATGSKSFLRINRAYITTAGSSEVNEGDITVTIGGNTQAFIEANQGQTHQTHFTVPNGKYFLITSYFIGVGRMGGSTDLHILGQIKLDGQTSWRSITDIYLWDGGRHHNDHGAELIPPKTEIRQRIISTATTQAHGIYGGYLIDANYIDSL